MPLRLRRGSVSAIIEQLAELIRLEVDGLPCVAYPRVTGPVLVGDEVLVNVEARELGLGSGGFDIVYANLTRGLELAGERGAHVMKLPYTPLQTAVTHAEEAAPVVDSLAGMPVVCCSLHSQVAAVCAGIGEGARVAYVQLPGGALPVSLSDAVRELKRRGLVRSTVAVGACVDGDVACVSAASALLWAAAAAYDVAICAIGPGIVGTGTFLGHGGLAAAEAANAAAALGGTPIIALRVSAADPRERHLGVSHHTRAVLRMCLSDVVCPWPAGEAAPVWLESLQEVDVSAWRAACAGLPLEHMGRGPDEDPPFFAAAYAAGVAARERVGGGEPAAPHPR